MSAAARVKTKPGLLFRFPSGSFGLFITKGSFLAKGRVHKIIVSKFRWTIAHSWVLSEPKD